MSILLARAAQVWDPFLDLPLDPAEWDGYYQRCRETGVENLVQGQRGSAWAGQPVGGQLSGTDPRSPYMGADPK